MKLIIRSSIIIKLPKVHNSFQIPSIAIPRMNVQAIHATLKQDYRYQTQTEQKYYYVTTTFDIGIDNVLNY